MCIRDRERTQNTCEFDVTTDVDTKRNVLALILMWGMPLFYKNTEVKLLSRKVNNKILSP